MIIEKRNHIRKSSPAQMNPFDEFGFGTHVNWGYGPVQGNVFVPWLFALMTAVLTGIVAYVATDLVFWCTNTKGLTKFSAPMDGILQWCINLAGGLLV